jgi:hypothetical protein
MYQLVKNIQGNVVGAKIVYNGYLISFLFDPDNTDYQQYLKWIAEGNTPLPADE